MTDPSEAGHLGRGLCLVVLIAHVMAGAANYWTLLRETQVVLPFVPRPFYGFMPVPMPEQERPALGADFSQVYLAASAIRHGDSPYAPQNPAFHDRFGRRPNYPPLTNHLYVPLTFLPYRDALIMHTVAAHALFAGLCFIVLTRYGQRRRAPLVVLSSLMLVLLTPIGFAQFERGQFDLFIASAFLLVTAAIYAGRAATPFAIAGACLGALKWTSAPFLLGMSFLALAGSSRLRRRVAFWAVPAVFFLSAALFIDEIREYGPSLRDFELAAKPTDVSLEQFLPGGVAKAVPAICTLGFVGLFLLRSRRGWDRQAALEAVATPFALGLCLLTMCMPKVVYEYRVATLLGLLPILVIWLERGAVPRTIRQSVALLYGGFCVLGFRVFDFTGDLMTSPQMLWIYCLVSLAFLGLAVHILWKLPFEPPATIEQVPTGP